MKERRCDNCAWGRAQDGDDVTQDYCHYDREPVRVYAGWWCRHWSETTGWDVFEKQQKVDLGFEELQKQLRIAKGLLQLASELFEKDVAVLNFQKEKEKLSPYFAHQLGVRQRWLEEYRTKC